jgi:hypothetical protein
VVRRRAHRLSSKIKTLDLRWRIFPQTRVSFVSLAFAPPLASRVSLLATWYAAAPALSVRAILLQRRCCHVKLLQINKTPATFSMTPIDFANAIDEATLPITLLLMKWLVDPSPSVANS